MINRNFRKGLQNLAKVNKKSTEEVQLLIFIDSEQQAVGYKRVIRGEASARITFLEFLGLLFDLMNREAICAQFIAKLMMQFAEKYQCEPTAMFIMVYLDGKENGEDKVRYHLYKGKEPLEELDLEKLLE